MNDRQYVVVLRDGNRMLANSLESARAKLKKYGGRVIRPATKQDVTTHSDVKFMRSQRESDTDAEIRVRLRDERGRFVAGATAAMARLDALRSGITLDDILNGAETLGDLVGTA